MKELITGSSGFLGKHLSAHLAEIHPKSKLYGASLSRSALPALENFQCDFTDKEAVAELIQKLAPDCVYHLVGVSQVDDSLGMEAYFKKNYLSTVNLVEALRQLRKPVGLFFASSVHVYGNQAGEVAEERAAKPVSYYGFTKYLAELYLRWMALSQIHLKVVVGRLYSNIGPGQAQGFVVSDFCEKISSLPSNVTSKLQVGALDGKRQFMDVRDAVQIFPRFFEAASSSRYEVYNIASTEMYRISDVLEHLLVIAGKTPHIMSNPGRVPNSFLGVKVSTDKLRSTFPDYAGRKLEETLRDTYFSVRQERTYAEK